MIRYRNIRIRQEHEITPGVRDARQNGVDNISGEEKVRFLVGELAPWRLPAGLHHCRAEAPRRRMVTLTRTPYAEAARRACQRDRIVYVGAITLSLLIAASVIAALAQGLPAGRVFAQPRQATLSQRRLD
jgi:hypothetical protein